LEIFKKRLMNFFITKDNNYSNNLNLNFVKHKNFNLFFDNGWEIYENKLYKGTSNNFCEIILEESIRFNHNKLRDFPLWYNNDSCTNITELENYLPVDGVLTLKEKTLEVSYIQNFYADNDKKLNEFESLNLLKKVLLENVKTFLLTNTKKIFLPNNNGLDTLVVQSILNFLKVDYQTFDIQKLDYTPLQQTLEKNYYGFNQIQLFKEPKCVITGFYGDEYILRSPFYVQHLIKDDNTDLVEIFEQHKSCYMNKFFMRDYKEKCSKILKKSDKQKIKEMICNDIQVWHMDNTFVFTPFKDFRLLELLNCELSVIVDQVTDGKLSKKLIEYFDPTLLKNIDAFKNINDPYWFN